MNRLGRINHWLVLGIAVLGVQSPLWLGGRTLLPIVPSNGVVGPAPFGYRGPVPDWTITTDPMGGFNISYANDAYAAASYRNGTFPFWNPYQGLGQPFLANGLSAALYPLNWVDRFLPSSWWDVVYLINWWLAACFLFTYLHYMGVPGWAANVASVSTLVSAQIQINLPLREMIESGAWFPLLLYGIERGLRDPNWQWRHVIIAVSVYATITGGQPEVSFLSLFVCLLYGLARLIHGGRPLIPKLLLVLPGTLGGLLLSAPMWLNFAKNLSQAVTTHTGVFHGSQHLGLASVATYFFPLLYGRVQQYPFGEIKGWLWNFSPGWSQAMSLFLALSSILGIRRNRTPGALGLWTIALLVGAKIWGFPGIHLLGELPIFNLIKYPGYGAFLLDFAVLGLTAFGIFALSKADSKTWIQCICIWLALSLAVFAIGVFPIRSALNHPEFYVFGGFGLCWALLAPLGLWWVRSISTNDNFTLAGVAVVGIALQALSTAPSGYTLHTHLLLSIIAMLLFLLLLIALSLVRPGRRPLVLLLTGPIIALVPGIAALTGARGLPMRFDPLNPAPFMAFLSKSQEGGLYRSYSLDSALQADFAAPFGISSLNLLEGLVPAPSAYFLNHFLDRESLGVYFTGNVLRWSSVPAEHELQTNRAYFDLVATKYIVSVRPDLDTLPLKPPLRLAYVDNAAGVRVWENSQSAARILFFSRVLLVQSWQEAVSALASVEKPGAGRTLEEDSELLQTAWVQIPADPVLAKALEGLRHQAPEPASIKRLLDFKLSANETSITFESGGPGVLVMTDSYSPGWEATVDGLQTPVLQVDGAFRGVYVSAPGRHVIQQKYRPPLWPISMLLFLLGLLIVGAVTLKGFSARLVPQHRREL